MEINRAIKTRQLRILPKIARLNPGGIDLQVDSNVVLRPGHQKLVATTERVELSENFLGILHIRSSLAREGVIASLALVDPGFQGQLTVSLYNAGDRLVRLQKGERFIQLSLFRLGTPAQHAYSGNYQNSRGVVESRRRKNVRARKMENVIHTRRG
jgi:dCTP deaminase